MRINTNVMALNAYNSMNKIIGKQTKNMQAFSSGFRINKAADDSAGLSISEKMRGQIRGLEQAERNIQDGISLTNTAEGGTRAVLDPFLHRIRELLIQAANGTMTSEDKDTVEYEINQMKSGIDDIANNTEFNEIKLLNGSNPHNKQVAKSDVISSDQVQGPSESTKFDYKDVLAVPPVDIHGNFRFATNKGYPTTEADNGKILVFGDGSTSQPTVRIENTSYILKTTNITPTESHDGVYTTVYNVSAQNVEIVQSVKIIEDKYEIKYSIKNNSGVAKDIGFMFNLDTKLGLDDNAPFIVDGNTISDQKKYETDIPDAFIIYNQNGIGTGINAEFQAGGIIKGDGIIEEPSKFGVGSYNTVSNWDWTPAGTVGDSAYSLWWDPRSIGDDKAFEVNTFYGQNIPPTINDPTKEDVVIPDSEPEVVETGPYSLKIQSGPNLGHEYHIELFDARTKSLGLEELNIDSYENIMGSLNKVDQAINKVIVARSRFGIDSNVLEHIYSNAASYEVNLASAESRIRDADVYKELSELNNNSIILEAAQSMLSEANKMTQSVLKLLK